MKITGVETLVLSLPLSIDGPAPMLGGRPRTTIDLLLVRVDTDQGITGWGEAFGHRIFPSTRAAIDDVLGPLCLGRDPSEIEAVHDELQRAVHGIGRNGPTMYALSGIDIACGISRGRRRDCRFTACSAASRARICLRMPASCATATHPTSGA